MGGKYLQGDLIACGQRHPRLRFRVAPAATAEQGQRRSLRQRHMGLGHEYPLAEKTPSAGVIHCRAVER